jgi:hypothetical protein
MAKHNKKHREENARELHESIEHDFKGKDSIKEARQSKENKRKDK